MALPLVPSAYRLENLHLEQCDPMSAAAMEPGAVSVIFQTK